MSSALRSWVEKTPKGRSVLAKAAGVRWQTVDDIVRGKHTPRAETARALSRATGGEVSAAAIMGLDADEHAATIATPADLPECA